MRLLVIFANWRGTSALVHRGHRCPHRRCPTVSPDHHWSHQSSDSQISQLLPVVVSERDLGKPFGKTLGLRRPRGHGCFRPFVFHDVQAVDDLRNLKLDIFIIFVRLCPTLSDFVRLCPEHFWTTCVETLDITWHNAEKWSAPQAMHSVWNPWNSCISSGDGRTGVNSFWNVSICFPCPDMSRYPQSRYPQWRYLFGMFQAPHLLSNAALEQSSGLLCVQLAIVVHLRKCLGQLRRAKKTQLQRFCHDSSYSHVLRPSQSRSK